jgi:hypothetical protein
MTHPIVPTRRPSRRGRPLLILLLTLALAGVLAPAAGAAIGEHHYLPAHSHVNAFSSAKGVATDSAGNLYVADSTAGKIKIFAPGGAAITEFAPAANGGNPLGVVVDSSGDVYVLGGEAVYRYKPSAPLPPTAATTYAADTTLNGTGRLVAATGIKGLAIDPVTDDVYLNEGSRIVAYTPAGTLISDKIGEGLTAEGLPFESIGVYGANHHVYGITEGIPGADEVQWLEITGATEGTYALTFKGQTTAPLAYGAEGPAITTALEALSTVGAGNVFVACGFDEPEYLECEMTFKGALAETAVEQITVDGSGLSGPAPAAETGTYTVGAAGTPETVYVLDEAGEAVIASFDGSDSPAGGFGPGAGGAATATTPKIAIDQSDGNVFVGDARYHHAVDEFDASGHYLSQFDPTFGSTAEPKFISEVALAVDNGATSPNQRDIYVAGGASVYAFGPTVQGYSLTVEKGSHGGTVESTPAGILCGPACAQQATVFEEGQAVILKASVAAGSRFVGWEAGDCEAELSGGTECEVTISAAKTVKANFVRTFTLSVAPSGPAGAGSVTSAPAGIDCGATCEVAFDEGASVTLTAAAASGFRLVGWAPGDCESEPSGGTQCVVTMGAAKLVEPRFLPLFKLSVAKTGDGTGTVTGSAGGIDCGATCGAQFVEGETVTLTATAASGSHFAGWSGACTGTGSCQVTVSAAKSVSAEFAADPPQTTPPGNEEQKPPSGGGAPQPAPTPTPTVGAPRPASTAPVSGGKAALTISCVGGTGCSGTVKLTAKVKGKTVVLGTAHYTVGAGQSKTVKVKLTAAAKELLAGGAVKAKLSGGGLHGTVTLKAAGK